MGNGWHVQPSGERASRPETVVSFVRTDAERWSAQSDDDDRAVLALYLFPKSPYAQ